jgi:hypothetical protein
VNDRFHSLDGILYLGSIHQIADDKVLQSRCGAKVKTANAVSPSA